MSSPAEPDSGFGGAVMAIQVVGWIVCTGIVVMCLFANFMLVVMTAMLALFFGAGSKF